RGVDVLILHKESIFEDLRLRRKARQQRAIRVVRGAAAFVEQPGSTEEQRTGANCNQSMAGANRGSKPANDGFLILRVGLAIRRAAPLRRNRDTPHRDHDRILGKRRGQRLDAMNIDTDRRTDRSCDADIADLEEDRLLFEVRAPKSLERSSKVEKRNTRRQNDDDWNFAFRQSKW